MSGSKITCNLTSKAYSAHTHHHCVFVFSDDMLIKLWDWDRKWSCSQVFEGHSHYVMEIVINPKDNNQFASASLDRTIKVYIHTQTHTHTHGNICLSTQENIALGHKQKKVLFFQFK